jgi:hypothetical protein
MRRRVILESPYGNADPVVVYGNVEYAKQCALDCLERGEAPIASHLLFTQFLDDKIPEHRAMGIEAGLAWVPVADAMVAYVDRGISNGMDAAMRHARRSGLPVELRTLNVIETEGPAT